MCNAPTFLVSVIVYELRVRLQLVMYIAIYVGVGMFAGIKRAPKTHSKEFQLLPLWYSCATVSCRVLQGGITQFQMIQKR